MPCCWQGLTLLLSCRFWHIEHKYKKIYIEAKHCQRKIKRTIPIIFIASISLEIVQIELTIAPKITKIIDVIICPIFIFCFPFLFCKLNVFALCPVIARTYTLFSYLLYAKVSNSFFITFPIIIIKMINDFFFGCGI